MAERPNTVPWITHTCRGVVLALALAVYLHRESVQRLTDDTWAFLRSTWVFNSVYFETWWTVVCYAGVLVGPYTCSKIRALDRYKIDPALSWQSAGLRTIVLEAVEYALPLMVLDLVTVKKYAGVDPREWDTRWRYWIQTTRALPTSAPSIVQITTQLAVSFVLYDAMFYCVHALLHKNLWLYRNVHAAHHQHDFVHSRVTNQLTVAERIVLVLSANEALKLAGGHPLTRMLFVPLFEACLVENHSGYDLPWSWDKLVPFGLVAGARQHVAHHTEGSRNYQPFFTYIDKLVNSGPEQKHTKAVRDGATHKENSEGS